ncbi:hypothetical protein ACLI4Z_15380 [Natrialbaceae archaeon A-arb3/5]
MVSIPSVGGLAVACKQYGPGRLPRADRRNVGAGYAAAAAALVVSVAFALGMFGLTLLGLSSNTINPFWGASALVSLPLVVPAAFVAGVLVWRLLPDGVPYFGAVAGVLATVATYLGALAVVSLAVLAARLAWWTGTGGVLTDVGGAVAFVAIFAGLFTAWLTIPVGCLGGAIYERARTAA